jgi:PREDICTED: hypothetical protein
MKNVTQNRERVKLLLAELEAELELLEAEDMNSCKAGYGGPVPNFPTGYFFAGGTGGFFHDNSNSNGGGSDWDTVPGNGSEEDPYQLQEVEVGGSSSSTPSYGGSSFYGGGNSFYEGGSFSNGGGGGESSSSSSSYGGVTPQTDCFFQCLGYISSKYGYHYDSSYYENQYYSNYGERGMGINPSYIDSFSSNYFSRSYLNLDSPNTMENFVANPNNSLIVIYNVGMGSDGVFEQHAVVVERIFGDTILCVDPQDKSGYKVIKKDQIVNYLAVTGNCH